MCGEGEEQFLWCLFNIYVQYPSRVIDILEKLRGKSGGGGGGLEQRQKG